MSSSIKKQLNVLNEEIKICSTNPLTGWYRDGCCNTDNNDLGTHTVCAKVNSAFLDYLKKNGNDLVTPRPEYGFEGLKEGDCWCVCALWFKQAVDAGYPCKVYLRSTNLKTLEIVELEVLKKHAIDLS
jgi:uncharacterized protein (DUF2237 family)